MRYINASVRVAEMNKVVHARVEGKLVTGYFYKLQNEPVQFMVKGSAPYDKRAFEYIEWLDEYSQPEVVTVELVKKAFEHAYCLGYDTGVIGEGSYMGETWAAFKAQNGLITEVVDPPKRDRPYEQG